MGKTGKKYSQAKQKLSQKNLSSPQEAFKGLIETAYTNFDESVDVAVILGIDPTKGEHTVRGSALLPHGLGRKTSIAVFAKGDYQETAKAAGADFVGCEDLVEKVLGGWTSFDAAVATPDVMGIVGKAARILGPRGLLPNKKVGTVTFDIAKIVEDLKKGRVSYRNDKGGVVHAPFGKISFGPDKLLENLKAFIKTLKSSKPASSKGKFIRKIIISSTMGAGIEINPDQVL